jgi:hypothetical protein
VGIADKKSEDYFCLLFLFPGLCPNGGTYCVERRVYWTNAEHADVLAAGGIIGGGIAPTETTPSAGWMLYLEYLDVAFPSHLSLPHFPDGHCFDVTGRNAMRLGDGVN